VTPPAAPTPAAPAPPATFELRAEPTIDVGLAWDLAELALAPVRVTGLSIQGAGEAPVPFGGHRIGDLSIRGSAGRAEVRIAGERGSRSLGPGDTLWLARSPEDGSASSRVGWNGRTWRGILKVFVNPRGKLTLVDRLPLETYLLGVVPGEIGALSEALLEAGRAQAIAARSYTLFYRGRRSAEGFDLYGTVEDQVYGPIESERDIASRCVESTRGRVALADGWPIRANYCSTCGGITAEVWEAWPADALPYLTSHRDRDGSPDLCAASPQYRWREEWSIDEFADNLGRFGPANGVTLPPGGVGEILDVRVAARSRSGRVWRLEVTTRNGSIQVPAYVLRQVLRRHGNPAAILRSCLLKVDVRRDPATGRSLAVIAAGAGSGHGVGLCQVGALGMARAGKSAERILEHYYSGIELRRMY
jgi:stage II sporulation protein D